MSYFQHTKKDLADAKREIGESLLALVDDSVRKLNADEELDQGYIMEDLLARLVAIAKVSGADVDLYPETTGQYESHVHAYPIDVLAAVEEKTAPVLDLSKAIRESWQLETFDGVRRHTFQGSYSGMVCGAMVMRRGSGEDCGLPATHVVHETDYDKRSDK